MLRTVSIMPGIEAAAPLRTETSRGVALSNSDEDEDPAEDFAEDALAGETPSHATFDVRDPLTHLVPHGASALARRVGSFASELERRSRARKPRSIS